MRSGSTLIGDILQRHDNSAYAFEPLRYIEEDIMNNNTVTFLNGTRRLYARNESTLLFADMLYRWFTCDVQKINIRDLQSNMLLYSYSYPFHYYCVRRGIDRFKNSAWTQVRIHIIKMCIEHLTRPCRSKKVMIIKTIRLEMASVKLLLKWLPGLKVVHLLRDPRGKLSSELKLDENRWSSIDSIASLHCNRMFSDVVQAYRLNKHYPNTIRILRYERFSNDPIDKTRKMFRFLNLNFTTKILEYVKSTTLNESVRENCYYCIKRTNAGLASTKWRVDLPHPHVQRIDRQCMKLYRIVGFVAMKDSNSLRNLSIPSQVASLKFMTL
ncbi:uncharacterized protein LOC117331483 [Pecten maximus]|uniref:uncharacterized protein LOC117331483 n=1 Tax=Pecten maximus TaxID=6579 RepID=UPI001458ED3A|nr:uncharacterized protein LOC117331483 [Pecten maximus]